MRAYLRRRLGRRWVWGVGFWRSGRRRRCRFWFTGAIEELVQLLTIIVGQIFDQILLPGGKLEQLFWLVLAFASCNKDSVLTYMHITWLKYRWPLGPLDNIVYKITYYLWTRNQLLLWRRILSGWGTLMNWRSWCLNSCPGFPPPSALSSWPPA